MDKYQEIKAAFELLRDEESAGKMAAYMRGKFTYYGIPTPDRRAVYKAMLGREKKNGLVDWNFLERCWNDEHREFQYVVKDYLVAMQKVLAYDDVATIERFIRSKQWWDTIDGLDRVIGNIAFTDSRINDLMLRWSEDEDFWVRRIAIDHQLCRKRATDVTLLERILVNNFGSSEFLSTKLSAGVCGITPSPTRNGYAISSTDTGRRCILSASGRQKNISDGTIY